MAVRGLYKHYLFVLLVEKNDPDLEAEWLLVKEESGLQCVLQTS